MKSIKVSKYLTNSNTHFFQVTISSTEKYCILLLIIILMFILLFQKKMEIRIQNGISCFLLFLLTLLLFQNIFISFVITLIVFISIQMIQKNRPDIENFEDITNAEPAIDKSIFSNEAFLKSKEGIQALLKKLDGGIELKEDDLKETKPLNIDIQPFKDDNKPNAMKIAQKETYELINTVNALKDTISTLSPVLQEGKKLMNMFENFKL